MPLKSLEKRAGARASAVQRLRLAQERLAAAKRRLAHARNTPDESAAAERVGECSAVVATREEWLHWIDTGESMRPEADGDWAHEHRPREEAGARRYVSMCR